MAAENEKATAGSDRRAGGKAPARIRLSAADRRETILRAATEAFAQTGYRAAKVADVAARVGVTEPVIFQNFGSKAALFAAVVERAAADVRAELDDLAAGPHDMAAGSHDMAAGSATGGLLAHVLTGFMHGWQGHAAADHAAADHAAGDHGAGAGKAGHSGAAYGVLFADAATLAADPELSEPARRAIRAVASHLADVVRRAQADGGVRADADPDAAAWLLLSVLSARRLRAAAMPDDIEPAITSLALRALMPPEVGPERPTAGNR